MYYTLDFFAPCPSTSTALRQRGTSSSIPFLCQFEFHTRSYFFTSSIISSSFPTLFPQMASLTAATRWQSQEARSGLCGGGGGGGGGGGRTVHPSFVFGSCVFKIVCSCALSCWRKYFVRSNSSLTLQQGFESLNVQNWANGLTTWYNVYQNHHFLHRPKQQSWLSPAEGAALNLFT